MQAALTIEKKLPVLEKGREISVNFEKFLWKFPQVAKNFNSTMVSTQCPKYPNPFLNKNEE
jgi:hypothetical protein